MARSFCFSAMPLAASGISVPRFFHLRQNAARSSASVPAIASAPASSRAVLVRASDDRFDLKTSQELQAGDALPAKWPENFSILNYEDLSAHYESMVFKAEAQPDALLADVMSTAIYTARPSQLLEEIDDLFSTISGLPVINESLKCVGVLSKKDRNKASKGLKSTIGEVMSSPAITLSADKTVKDAAVLMLKNKIHRIPIVNVEQQVIGIVTRTDIFTALEAGT